MARSGENRGCLMLDKAEKTNAMRLLDAKKVSYAVYAFSPDIHSADGVAAALGFPAQQVFKTLVVMPEKGRPLLAIIPGDSELDLKRMAQVANEKKMRMATQREAESLTGLLVGGISALALTAKGFKVYLHSSASNYSEVLVSAGQRGLNVRLAVADLVKVVNARVADIAHPQKAGEGS
jgi:Cys-tRNA(Pro)/Cys-tRNA(Cys) deacylase